MFERLEFNFFEEHYPASDLPWNDDKGKLTIAYDKKQNKTYCYYSGSSLETSYNLDFALDGNKLIKELETTDFENWKFLIKHGNIAYRYNWFIKFNYKNQPSRYINNEWNVPKEFYDFITILDKYFPKTNLKTVSNTGIQYDGDFKTAMYVFTHFTMDWKPDDETLSVLKKLTAYIDIFENKKEFGKWIPAPNTRDYYSSDNLFYFIDEVIQFKNIVKELEKIFFKLKFITGFWEDLLPDIEDFSTVSDEYLTDSRMAGTVLIKYVNKFCSGNASPDYEFDEALRNGTILKILKFIKELNHFE